MILYIIENNYINICLSEQLREMVDKEKNERRKDEKGLKQQRCLGKDCEKGRERKNRAEKGHVNCVLYFVYCTLYTAHCAL